MSSVVSWNLWVSINEGQLETFRTLMQEMVSASGAEPGTVGYEWFLSEYAARAISTSATRILTP